MNKSLVFPHLFLSGAMLDWNDLGSKVILLYSITFDNLCWFLSSFFLLLKAVCSFFLSFFLSHQVRGEEVGLEIVGRAHMISPCIPGLLCIERSMVSHFIRHMLLKFTSSCSFGYVYIIYLILPLIRGRMT